MDHIKKKIIYSALERKKNYNRRPFFNGRS